MTFKNAPVVFNDWDKEIILRKFTSTWSIT